MNENIKTSKDSPQTDEDIPEINEKKSVTAMGLKIIRAIYQEGLTAQGLML